MNDSSELGILLQEPAAYVKHIVLSEGRRETVTKVYDNLYDKRQK